MSVDVHPRIEARRREVHEDDAHRRLRWVLALMLLLAFGGLGYWLVHSPLLAVDRIVVNGDIDQAEVAALAAHGGLEVGSPILFVRRGSVVAAVTADPRVATAQVEVRYPHEVVIAVLAHQPVAWVASVDGWLHVTAAGHVAAERAEPGDGPQLALTPPFGGPGSRLTDAATLAGLEFVAALPAHLAATTRIDDAAGGLRAEIGEFTVQLGGPARMADKAAAAAALIASLEPGAAIDLRSPDRPAVLPAGEGSDGEPGAAAEDQVEG